ncbi:MAG: hypothetical protein ACM37W_07025 [Actinomycetota bacterium]
MAEMEPPASGGNWQEAIDRSFQERLLRPAVQPGVIDRNQLAGNILARSQQFANRVSLPPQLERHLSGVRNLSATQTPIVYAQPVKSEATGASGGVRSPANPPIAQRVPVPTVQAKFIQTADFAGVSRIPAANSEAESLPVVRSQDSSQTQAQPQQQLPHLSTSEKASESNTELPSSSLPVVKSQDRPQTQAQLQQLPHLLTSQSANQNPAVTPSSPLPVVKSQDSSQTQAQLQQLPHLLTSQSDQNPATTPSSPLAVKSQDSSQTQSQPQQQLPNLSISQNVNQNLAVTPTSPLPTPGSTQARVQRQLEPTALSTSDRASESPAELPSSPLPLVRSQENLQMQAPPQQPTTLSTSQNASQNAAAIPSLTLPTLPTPGTSQAIVQRKMGPNQAGQLPIARARPLTGESNAGDRASVAEPSRLTPANSQPSQTLVPPLPTVRARYGDRSIIAPKTPNLAVDPSSTSGDRTPKVQPLPPTISEATGNQPPATSGAESPLPVVQVANSPRSWLQSQPHPLLPNQDAGGVFAPALPSKTSPPELGTPLILSVPPSFAGQKQANNPQNNPQNLTSQQYSSAIGQANYNPASPGETSVSQYSAASARYPLANAGNAEGNSMPETNKQPKIDVEALTDKIERKLIRRLAIENERRGQGRWR